MTKLTIIRDRFHWFNQNSRFKPLWPAGDQNWDSMFFTTTILKRFYRYVLWVYVHVSKYNINFIYQTVQADIEWYQIPGKLTSPNKDWKLLHQISLHLNSEFQLYMPKDSESFPFFLNHRLISWCLLDSNQVLTRWTEPFE